MILSIDKYRKVSYICYVIKSNVTKNNKTSKAMNAQAIKTQKTITETFFIDGEPFTVEFSGKRGSIEIHKIDGKSDVESYFQEWVIDDLYIQADVHMFKYMYLGDESQAEAMSDESRGR